MQLIADAEIQTVDDLGVGGGGGITVHSDEVVGAGVIRDHCRDVEQFFTVS